VTLDDAVDLSPRGVACVPAGTAARVGASAPAAVLVVAVPADPAPDPAATPRTVDLDACEFAPPATSDVDTARLTARLGCAGTKVNARRLDPGGSVPYHTEGDQEELFVPLSGSTAMRIDGETIPAPPGTVTRVAPPVPRSAVDEGDGSLWVMVGAPPTGGPTEWDPGAEILE
jgi:quercetin dioxygenase-like cupin family protein